MIKKESLLKIESYSTISRDLLLYGPQKTAFKEHKIGNNLIHARNSLNLVSELKKRNIDDWVVFRARAIDAGGSGDTIYHGANDNGDYFSEEELLAEGEDGRRAFETFINVPIFTNHQNDDIEKARGRVINSIYDKDNHCIYVDAMIDGKAYPELARGVREGYIREVSMGAMSGSSRILLDDGTWKSHEDIIIGDKVITHSGQTQSITMIARTNEPKDCYNIHFVGQDNPLVLSHDHPILTIQKDNLDDLPEFINAEELNIGDYLLSPLNNGFSNEENLVEEFNYRTNTLTQTLSKTDCFVQNGFLYSPVKKIEKKKTNDFFYHIEVGGNENQEIDKKSDHSYIADGIAVHNCTVQWSKCSICGNKATKEDEYCNHIRNYKGKKFGGKSVYEDNYGIKFIELSGVTDAACENCSIHSVFKGKEFMDKFSDVIEDMASTVKASWDTCSGMKKYAAINKESRGEDIDKLNKSLDLLKDVSLQILKSKDVDFEYLKDSGEIMSELQNLIVDLVEGGFANQQVVSGKPGAPVPGGEQPRGLPPVGGTEPPNIGGAESLQPSGLGGTSVNQPQEGLVSEPAPIAASNKSEKNIKYSDFKEGLLHIGSEVKDLIGRLNELKQFAEREINMPTEQEKTRSACSAKISEKFNDILDKQIKDNKPIVISKGPYSISIDFEKGIRAFANGNELLNIKPSEVDKETIAMAKASPETVANQIIDKIEKLNFNKEEIKMGSKEEIKKEALQTNPPPINDVQERQLENLSGNSERKNDPDKATGQVGVTTEGQLESIPKTPETGKGDASRKRPKDPKDNLEITEGQLDDSRPTNYGVDRDESGQAAADGQLGEVGERQLGKSDEYGGVKAREDNDQTPGTRPIGEGQLGKGSRVETAVEEIGEGQMKGHRQGTEESVSSDASPHTMSGRAGERIVTAILDGLANVVINEKISPDKLSSVKILYSGVKSPSKIERKAQLSDVDVQNLAETFISKEIGDNMDMVEPYLEKAIEVMYKDPELLSKEISKSATERINELKDVAENKKGTETVEEEKEASVFAAWNKRAINIQDVQTNETTVTFQLSEAGLTGPENIKDELGSPSDDVKSFIAQKISKDPGNVNISQLDVDGNGLVTAKISYTSTVEKDHAPDTYSSDSVPQQEVSQEKEVIERPVETETAPVGAGLSASIVENLQKIAESDKIKKEAQNPAGTTLPPPGGAMPAPEAPGSGLENLTETPSPGNLDEVAGNEEGEDDEITNEGEAKPFGSICPRCGSDDVDVLDGDLKCNNCGTEASIKINLEILNPEVGSGGLETSEEVSEESSEGEDISEQINAAPAAAMAPSPVPAAPGGGVTPPMANVPGWIKTASLQFEMKLNPEDFYPTSLQKKYAEKKDKPIPIGNICPQCGSRKVSFQNSEGICTSCGSKTFIEAKQNEDKIDVLMTFQPNLKISEEKNLTGGYAVSADCEDCEEIREAINKVLSKNKEVIKVAALSNDSWLTCIADQVSNSGYSGDDAIQICASIKDMMMKSAQLDFPDKKDDDGDEEKSDIEVIDDGKEDSVEFEEDKKEDSDGLEEVIEDEKKEVEITPEGIEKITIEGTDAKGKEFEVEMEVAEQDIKDEEEKEIEEEMGIDVEVAPEDGDILEIEEKEIIEGPEDLLDEETQIVEEEDIMKNLFSDGLELITEDEESDEIQKKLTPEEELELSANTSELLRGNKIANSDRGVGNFLNIDHIAQSLQMNMPKDVEVEVPRNEEQGIREDGEAASNDDHENTAKEMKGNLAGVTNELKEVDTTPERGVEIIEPKKSQEASKDSTKKKAKTKDTKKEAQSAPFEVGRETDLGIEDEENFPETDVFSEKQETDLEEVGNLKVQDVVSGKDENGNIIDDSVVVSFVRSGPVLQAKVSGEEGTESFQYAFLEQLIPQKEDLIDDLAPARSDILGREEVPSFASKDKKWMKVEAQNYQLQESEPTDSGERAEPDPEVPRDKSKAKPETQSIVTDRPDVGNPKEVRDGDYDKGPEGKDIHTDVVPRDSSGDGVGGKSVDFDKEKADERTSGNPDSYVQTLQDRKDPTPAGNEENHAIAEKEEAMKKEAKAKVAADQKVDEVNLDAIIMDDHIFVQNNENGKIYKVNLKE